MKFQVGEYILLKFCYNYVIKCLFFYNFFNLLDAYIDNKERCKTDLLGSRKNVVFYKDTEEAFDLAEVNKEKKFLWTHLYFENKNEKVDHF